MDSFASFIDHTLLKAETREEEVKNVCQEAREYQFKTVCISPQWVKVAAQCLAGSQVLPITVIGFPSGSVSTAEKEKEARQAIADGAQELDMVLNRTLLKAFQYAKVEADIRAVVLAGQGKPVKVILETSELTQNEKIIACALVKASGAHFVKTSTGFSNYGAQPKHLQIMRSSFNKGIKISGGVNPDNVRAFIEHASAESNGYIDLDPMLIRVGETSLLEKI